MGRSIIIVAEEAKETDLMQMPITPYSVSIRLNWHCQSQVCFHNIADQYELLHEITQICITSGKSNEVCMVAEFPGHQIGLTMGVTCGESQL